MSTDSRTVTRWISVVAAVVLLACALSALERFPDRGTVPVAAGTIAAFVLSALGFTRLIAGPWLVRTVPCPVSLSTLGLGLLYFDSDSALVVIAYAVIAAFVPLVFEVGYERTVRRTLAGSVKEELGRENHP